MKRASGKSIAIHVRVKVAAAAEATRLARWKGESLSGYVARLIERDVSTQRHTLAALAALEAAEGMPGGAP